MQQELWSSNRFDDDGKPAGGHAVATGLTVVWQQGPLGRGHDRVEPNGAFVETVIEAARRRLRFYQETEFACAENSEAIRHLGYALAILERRTAGREARQVEGTHTV